MNNPMLSNVRAGIDLRGSYELELADCIERRRCIARAQLEASERTERKAPQQARETQA